MARVADRLPLPLPDAPSKSLWGLKVEAWANADQQRVTLSAENMLACEEDSFHQHDVYMCILIVVSTEISVAEAVLALAMVYHPSYNITKESRRQDVQRFMENGNVRTS